MKIKNIVLAALMIIALISLPACSFDFYAEDAPEEVDNQGVSIPEAENQEESDEIGWKAESDEIIGSVDNLQTVPSEAVFENGTTTPATGEGGMLDGGAEVTQAFATQNVDEIKLFTMAKGDTATSTLNIRQQASFDDRNYFDIPTSTADRVIATSTLTLGNMLLAVSFDPGLATTSKVLTFDTLGYAFTRFVVWSDNLASDPLDGVQAYIKVVKVIAANK